MAPLYSASLWRAYSVPGLLNGPAPAVGTIWVIRDISVQWLNNNPSQLSIGFYDRTVGVPYPLVATPGVALSNFEGHFTGRVVMNPTDELYIDDSVGGTTAVVFSGYVLTAP